MCALKGGKYILNFVFVSPQFPKTYWNFCDRLKRNGVNVLGIGDSGYDEIPDELKECLTEYYRVDSMADYDAMVRAMGYFTFKYGKIDWLESNNEFWLEQDAKLRTDFNITSGDNETSVMRYKTKSNMKAYYEKANVPVARYHMVSTYEEGKKFVDLVGYPVIVKPDDGVGANTTWKIKNDKQLKDFYKQNIQTQYIMEEFVPGSIVSFDGIVDQDNNIIFQTSHVFPEPIMDIVNSADECWYYSEREIPKDLVEMGTRVIKAFDIRGRFFHTEYFRLYEDKEGLGKKGDLVGLEVNMRPPGGYTPDMMNYANDINVYLIYANMAMYNEGLYKTDRPYHCVYVGRRDKYNGIYTNGSTSIFSKYGQSIVMHERMPDLLSSAMGNEFYIARFKTKKEVKDFVNFVYKKDKVKK